MPLIHCCDEKWQADGKEQGDRQMEQGDRKGPVSSAGRLASRNSAHRQARMCDN
ncbi:MAG TPA: hypothetical protein VFQ36_14050 [Ktedonobacteraceae bacterium]|nr:hypothetical protein [Ktedonobacteraceae bacterium]